MITVCVVPLTKVRLFMAPLVAAVDCVVLSTLDVLIRVDI